MPTGKWDRENFTGFGTGWFVFCVFFFCLRARIPSLVFGGGTIMDSWTKLRELLLAKSGNVSDRGNGN